VQLGSPPTTFYEGWQAGSARLRFYVDGESRPELELVFAHAEKGATKIATGALAIPAGSRWAVECVWIQPDGTPYPSQGLFDNRWQPYWKVADMAFNWTIGGEAL
jgi:hypothetical protein